MKLKGIDISEWQGYLTIEDFNKIKNSGIEFVIIRCGFTGYGKSKNKLVDKYFENNYKLAKQVGLPVGTYYYSCATTVNEGIEEANFVLNLIKGKKFEFPIVIDTEDNHDISNPKNSSVSQASIGKNNLTPIIKAFCNTVEKAGNYVSIYASTYWFKNNLILADLTMYDKWIAQWSESVSFSEKYGIWQYSSKGSVPGISGNVDMNYAYKDYSSLMKQVGLNGFEKVVVPDDNDQETPPEDDDETNNEEDNNEEDNSDDDSTDDDLEKTKLNLFKLLLHIVESIWNFVKSFFSKK